MGCVSTPYRAVRLRGASQVERIAALQSILGASNNTIFLVNCLHQRWEELERVSTDDATAWHKAIADLWLVADWLNTVDQIGGYRWIVKAARTLCVHYTHKRRAAVSDISRWVDIRLGELELAAQ
jgi:hypothetical protein